MCSWTVSVNLKVFQSLPFQCAFYILQLKQCFVSSFFCFFGYYFLLWGNEERVILDESLAHHISPCICGGMVTLLKGAPTALQKCTCTCYQHRFQLLSETGTEPWTLHVFAHSPSSWATTASMFWCAEKIAWPVLGSGGWNNCILNVISHIKIWM